MLARDRLTVGPFNRDTVTPTIPQSHDPTLPRSPDPKGKIPLSALNPTFRRVLLLLIR